MDNKLRHAYLILYHDSYQTLCKCLSLLDDFRNDIYLHVDRKIKDFPFDLVKQIVSQAQLSFVKRNRVTWGGFSMIKAELELLREATNHEHAYYHLMSGVSMPLKTQDEIYAYFNHNSKNYVHVSEKQMSEKAFLDRVRYYHFFSEITGRSRGYFCRILRLLDSLSIRLQKILKIDRIRNTKKAFLGGSQWFSITHDLATYVLSQEKNIEKYFNWGFCVDELFLQTLAYQSPYMSSIVNKSLNLIDWTKGRPYTFTIDDYNDIIQSDYLFARKFSDEHIDVVNKIYGFVKNKQSLLNNNGDSL